MSRSTKDPRQLRRTRELQHSVIDELTAGRIDRRTFLRHGARLGLSIPLMTGLLGTVGLGLGTAGRARAQTPRQGGTMRVAQITPAGRIDPITVADQGGLSILGLVGDYLIVSGPDLVLRPSIATSWEPNEDGSVWTFTIRDDVKFHDGRPLTADDVVASISKLADPANGSNALSAFKGVLSKEGVRKVDDTTVEFTLDAPNGNFPYYLSSDNYNAIIWPADTEDFESEMIGSGPFKLESYTPRVGGRFVRNEEYWDGAPPLERVEVNFYADTQPQVLALLGGQVDFIQQIVAQGSQAILDNPIAKIIRLPASTHRQIHMKTQGDSPFADKRIRQAMALTLDREGYVKGLFRGMASVGNDSPFAPVFPSTNETVQQRNRDIDRAKALMAEAGSTGFNVTLSTMNFQELPALAQLVKNAGAEIGINVDLQIMDTTAYYGSAVPGNSVWLDSTFGITDYGHRGTPNVFLVAPLTSAGTWNAANFENATYDKLVADYLAAVELGEQQRLAGEIQSLLLDETPVMFPYFYDFLVATGTNVVGALPTAMGHYFLQKAGFV